MASLLYEMNWTAFFRSVPEFERMLVRSGIKLVKYWFSITDDEQQFRHRSDAEVGT